MDLLHIVALKQYWLDCYVCDLEMMNLLTDSLPNKIWINLEGFFKVIEAAQRTHMHHFLSPKRYEKKSRLSFLVKKMLCKD